MDVEIPKIQGSKDVEILGSKDPTKDVDIIGSEDLQG